MDGWQKRVEVRKYTVGLAQHLARNGITVTGYVCDDTRSHCVRVPYRQYMLAEKLVKEYERSPMRFVARVLLKFAIGKV